MRRLKRCSRCGGSGWVCSGTALGDSRNTYSLVITAGHCVYDESSGGGLSGFATNWLFIPQFDSSPTLLARWRRRDM